MNSILVISVLPSAIKPAMTSAAPALRSVAFTFAPRKLRPPVYQIWSFVVVISASIFASSKTWFTRFS